MTAIGLEGRVRKLQDRIRKVSHGRYLVLEEERSPKWNCFKIYSVDGEGFDGPRFTRGIDWPSLATVASYKNTFVYELLDNGSNWFRERRFGYALTLKGARKKCYVRAKKIGEEISKITGLSLIDRSK